MLCGPVLSDRQGLRRDLRVPDHRGSDGGKGISYDLSNATAKSPAAIEGEHLKFALPQPFEKALDMRVEIDGHSLIARAKGYITDYWEKVS